MKKLTIREAERLNKEGIANILRLESDNPRAQEFTDRMTSHTQLVADAARQIADKVPGMDAEKAYIYGILHDYGKYFGDVLGKRTFHGLVGYKKLMEMGYEDVAKINLTHTFFNKDFNMEEYASYSTKDLLETKAILNDMNYDDYDLLLQLSDLLPKMFDGYDGIKVRFERLKKVYNIADEVVERRFKDAFSAKEYFERKGNFNIYEMLGIVDE